MFNHHTVFLKNSVKQLERRKEFLLTDQISPSNLTTGMNFDDSLKPFVEKCGGQ
jgi:hypothetical protein